MSKLFSRIHPDHLLKAITEADELGRKRFLRKYGAGRSSKFFLLHDERLYDTKAIAAAACSKAIGKHVTVNRFSGGTQTLTAIQRAINGSTFKSDLFEDTFGELRNLTDHFDRLTDATWAAGSLGFSDWVAFRHYEDLYTGRLPGVYLLAQGKKRPSKMSISSDRIVYIGETVTQTIKKRLYQFDCSISGRTGHSGGETLRDKGYSRASLWLSIRSFPLRGDVPKTVAESFRSAQIRFLERLTLYQYIRTNGRYPPGNRK